MRGGGCWDIGIRGGVVSVAGVAEDDAIESLSGPGPCEGGILGGCVGYGTWNCARRLPMPVHRVCQRPPQHAYRADIHRYTMINGTNP